MHPKNISITDYSYDLPAERIAGHPLAERDQSRLLIYRDGQISESRYRNMDECLPAHTLLFFNDTRVVEARLLFHKETGARIELFCLEPGDDTASLTTAMAQQGTVNWKCLIGGASKWTHGLVLQMTVDVAGVPLTLRAEWVEKTGDAFLIRFSWEPEDLSFAEVLHAAGRMPLPPYIKRAAEQEDTVRYQTVYAQEPGSVAAPTAGLHFTESLIRRLLDNQIRTAFLTLHVGAGTFKPVKAGTLEGHEMHAEYMEISRDTIRELLQDEQCPVVAVGTTSLRSLETLYWLGVLAQQQPAAPPEAFQVTQWMPYEVSTGLTRHAALEELLHWMDRHQLERFFTKTQILIAPGYRFRVVDGLITNFHLPQSTLLLLVAALIGDDWKRVYRYALEHEFRFLSYGDGSLLWRKD